jgi:hypothetical protein
MSPQLTAFLDDHTRGRTVATTLLIDAGRVPAD